MELPVRKTTRIPGYDYSTRNYYFITICTHNKECIFGKPDELNAFGRVAKECIERISEIYSDATVEKYVVMPNHVHLILAIGAENHNEELPNVTHIIGQYKMSVAKQIHKISPECIVWQRSFHDHIIRNQQAFEKIWLYIEGNPSKWEEDCYFV